MSVSREFEAYVLEQLSPAGEVTSKRMFGGVGIYLEGEFVALIGADSSALFLKVDDQNRAAYEERGMTAFRPYRDKPTVMSYYQVPADVLEDAGELARWASESLAASLRSSRKKRGGKGSGRPKKSSRSAPEPKR